MIGCSVLAISILLFFFHRLLQDSSPVRLREDVSPVPTPREQALIDEAARPLL